MRIINDCQPEQSIIRDYTKMTDNQLEVNVLKGYEQAIEEKERRQKSPSKEGDFSPTSTLGRKGNSSIT